LATADKSREHLASAIEAMRAALGAQWIITDDHRLRASYVDPGSLAGTAAKPPAGAAMPGSVDDVRHLMAIANQYHVTLWPLVGAGAYVAEVAPDAIVVDPLRMNRIVEVNEKFAYALVEPGVTYAQLHRYLAEKKSRLWLDCASLEHGSLVADTLDRSFGHTPYADHVMMQCGMEIVLPDGMVVKTGMGAMPKSSSWQLFKYGYGPVTDGSFTQSSLGIVTKMGIWLMPAPPASRPFMITVPREEGLGPLVEALRPLKVTMTIPNTIIVSHILHEAALAAPRQHYYSGSGPTPDSIVKKLATDLDRGVWNVYAALYGLPVGIDTAWKVIRERIAAAVPGARFFSGNDRANDKVWRYRSELMTGVPATSPSPVANWAGGGRAAITQVAPLLGADLTRAFKIAKDACARHGFDYLGQFIATWRSANAANVVSFDPASADSRSRARECATTIIAEMAAAGYGTIATCPELHPKVVATYSAHDGALWNLHRKLKQEFDPNTIIAPPIPSAST
jgi:4-cresol dehydrogenase (hydroxylating)